MHWFGCYYSKEDLLVSNLDLNWKKNCNFYSDSQVWNIWKCKFPGWVSKNASMDKGPTSADRNWILIRMLSSKVFLFCFIGIRCLIVELLNSLCTAGEQILSGEGFWACQISTLRGGTWGLPCCKNPFRTCFPSVNEFLSFCW